MKLSIALIYNGILLIHHITYSFGHPLLPYLHISLLLTRTTSSFSLPGGFVRFMRRGTQVCPKKSEPDTTPA
jgi:hypothetical protein